MRFLPSIDSLALKHAYARGVFFNVALRIGLPDVQVALRAAFGTSKAIGCGSR
jgi:hypothetical protein